MGRIALGLLIAGCLGLCVWAQAPEGQTAPGQAPAAEQKAAEPKAAEQNHASEQPPATPAIEATEYPLDKFKNFSAIQNGGPLPGLESDVHLYRSGNQMRSEGSVAVPRYYVTDLAKRRSTSVSSHTCLNMGTAYVRTFPFFVPEPGNTYEITPIGEQTVDGHQCKVEDIKIHRLKRPEVPEFRLYEAEDLQGFPIRIENHRKSANAWVIKFKNVRLEPQDRTLFIIPEKCESDLNWKKMGVGATPESDTPKTKTPKKPQ